MGIGVFDVATAGDDEQTLRKQAAHDKLAAAIYDVREKHGEWLFGASDLDAFNDRAKLAFVSICQTIEPHLHARTGVHRKVMKTLEREWRQRQAAQTEDTMAQVADQSVAGSQAGRGIPKPPAPIKMHTHQPQLVGQRRQAADVTPGAPSDPSSIHPMSLADSVAQLDTGSGTAGAMGLGPEQHHGRHYQACWPGCHEDEAHAKKFHKDEKEGRRNQAAGGQMAPPAPPGGIIGPNPGPPLNTPGTSNQVPDLGTEIATQTTARRRMATGDPNTPVGGAQTPVVDIIHSLGDPAEVMPPTHQGGRRRAGPSVQDDPQRAHQVLDRMHELADEKSQHHHDVVDRAKQKVDERSAPAMDPYAGDPLQDLMGSPLGQHFQEQAQFGKPVQPPINPEHFARRYYAEFEDQPDHPELDTHETYEPHTYEKLEPKGDFDAYKNRVDQGAESKVDRDFTAPDPRNTSTSEVTRHDDDGSHNFVPTITGARAYPEYARIAALINADISAPPGAPGMGGSGAPEGATAPNGAAQAPSNVPAAPAEMTATPPAGGAGGATPVDPTMGAPVTASREYQLIAAMVRTAEPLPAPTPAGPAAAGSPAGGPGNNAPITNVAPGTFGMPDVATQGVPGHLGGRKWALKQIREVGTKEARKRLLAVARSHGLVDDKSAARVHALLTNKVADSNYLQKADEALTKVLNEKAEEFQNTIAPLQQALITIQQAEQMSNPLNVSPPAGTVNVLPGQQQQQGAPGAAMDQTGGGVGMGAQPAAAGLAGQPATQAMQAARKRGGRGKGQRG